MKRMLMLGLLLGMACGGAVQARSLPEFAGLVEKESAIVVNISATRSVQPLRAPALREGEPGRMPEWLRRWLPQPQQELPEGAEEDDQSVGSGFVIDSAGHILTNAHVVEEASEIMLRLNVRL